MVGLRRKAGIPKRKSLPAQRRPCRREVTTDEAEDVTVLSSRQDGTVAKPPNNRSRFRHLADLDNRPVLKRDHRKVAFRNLG